MTFAYDTNNRLSTITDSLSRQITLTYGGSDPVYYIDISYKGFSGVQRTIRINSTTLSNVLRTGYAIQTYGQLFPELYSSSPVDASISITHNPSVVSSVTLPNNRQYQFSYNSYGEVARVIFPTGGAVEYDVTPGAGVFSYSPTDDYEIYRRVSERRLYPSGGTGSSFEGRTTFTVVTNNPGDSKPWYTTVTVDHLNQSGTLVGREKHYFYGSGLASLFKFFTGVNSGEFYSAWIDGREYQTEALDTSGNVLRRVANVWQQRAPVSWVTGPADYAPANDPRIVETSTTLCDTNQIAKQSFSYDQHNNRTDVYEYDFGAGAAPAFATRHTHTGFLGVNPVNGLSYANPANGASYTVNDIHLRSLPAARIVYAVNSASGAETMVAQSTRSYDEPAYPLLPYGAVTGWTDPTTTGRGNVTTTASWIDTTGAYLQTHAQYDQCGNVRNTWDAKGNQAQFEYSSAYAYAYPTLTRTAAPDPSGAYASTAPLVATSVYDFDTGFVTSSTDPNGQTTSFEHTDLLDRLTRVNLPDGGRTTYIYLDTHPCGPMVETRTLLDSTGREADNWQFFDGLGRLYLLETYENQDANNPYLRVDKQYDSMGRVYRVSSPYRTPGCTSTVNPSGRWIQTTFDALSRPTQVSTSDGAAMTTAYSGNTVTVTDQAGKKRRSVTDALGRPTRIDESDSNGNLGLASAPAQPTSYTYDALGNLRKVDQGSQQRFFMYDSLGRLVRAKNPEQAAGSAASNLTDTVTGNTQWSMAYSYDNNGNLTSRVDARNVTTTYAYDALNRNTTVRYTDGTKDIDRHYDGAINGKGRFWYSNWDPNNNTRFDTHLAIDQYDTMGRLLNYRQHFLTSGVASPQFNVTRTYDKAGHVLTQTYPSGHTVSYGYDIVGRINSDSGNLGDGVTRNYSTGITYSELGGLQQEQFGTQVPLYHKLHYNVRGQLNDMRLSSVPWATDQWNWNRGAIVNYYATADLSCQTEQCRVNSGPDNNGNAIQSQHWTPANDQMSSYNWTEDRYAYDSLNRLKSVAEYHGSSEAGLSVQDYTQVYDYDRWGNRTIDPASSGVNNMQFDKADAQNTNRLYAPGDTALPQMNQRRMQYDPAGNLSYDSYTVAGQGARVYDAENRMKQAGTSNQWQTYTYDADGRRIKRNVNGSETWQLYGLDGELLAEYQAGVAPFLVSKEYGYRGSDLLVTMSSGDVQRLNRFVKNLYYNALARDASATELQQQMDTLGQAGVQGEAQLLTTARSIARGLFQSSEYIARGRTDSQYVTDLYNSYLQRGPDTPGLNFWVSNTQTNGRTATLNAFEVCSEFATLASTVYGTASGGDNQRVEHFVQEFYYGALQREPTSTEMQQQTQRLNNAAALGQSQVVAEAQSMGRDIFQATNYNSNHTDQEYVTDLYEAFLQRAPDGPGLNFWVSQTQANGRAATLTAFQVSTEYVELAGTLYREAFWLVGDHLGTPRMVINKSGSLAGIKRHDYLPFGEELAAGTGGRTITQGYTGDSVRQKFTQYERDTETGLDYSHARYYAGMQGRFSSIDPWLASGRVRNPQSWNRYAYVLNNPLRLIDPNGLVDDDPQKQPPLPLPPPRPIDLSNVPPPQVPTTAPQSTAPKVDDFEVGLPPVPATGPIVPAQAVNNVQPGQIVSPTLMLAPSKIEVTDNYNQRLISDGQTYQMTESVVEVSATPDVASGPVTTGSAYLDKNGTTGDIHRLTPNKAVGQFSDDLKYVARQTLIVIDARTGDQYTVGYNIIETTRSGTTITNCNQGCKP